MSDWKDTVSIVEAWGKSVGCESSEIYGRGGWERVLDGYDKIHTVLRKAL